MKGTNDKRGLYAQPHEDYQLETLGNEIQTNDQYRKESSELMNNLNDDVTTEPKSRNRRICTWPYWKDLLVACSAEFVGTAIYLYVALLSNQAGDILGVVFTPGGVIALLIMCFGKISGGHFNPAASLGFFLVGEIPFIRFLFYSAVQIAGSLAGSFTARGVLSQSIVYVEGLGNITQFEQFNGGGHFLQGGIPIHLAIIAEAIYCFNLMIVIFLVAVDSKTKTPLAPIAIGFIIIVCVLSGYYNTSGSFNPVRSFGAAMAIGYYRPAVWDGHYVYWIGPPLGSIVAALLYRIVFADEKHSIRRCVLELV